MQMRLFSALLIGAGIGLIVGCGPPERSPAGFSLPEGDPAHGQEAFVELKCNACHRVQGLDLPEPVADPPVPVTLGGTVDYQPTDGRFVASIIDPSHKVGPYPAELVKSGDQSRMADYSDVMTVRQLRDLVAFLHSRYQYKPTRPMH